MITTADKQFLQNQLTAVESYRTRRPRSEGRVDVRFPVITTVEEFNWNRIKTEFNPSMIWIGWCIQLNQCRIESSTHWGFLPQKKSFKKQACEREGRERTDSLSVINRPMTACDLLGEIDSLMALLVSCVISFWCDRAVMISDPAACSKELSAGTFNYRGGWFWRWSPPRLVFISICRVTVKQHYQRCHPKPKLLMYKSSAGPDYHSVLGLWATVALFLLTPPPPLLQPPPLLPLL